MHDDQRFPVRFFRSIRDPVGVPRRLTLPTLARALTTFRDTPRKDAVPTWAPIETCREGRRNEDVLALSCLVLDVDDGTEQRELAPAFPYASIIHTSWSHSADKPKWRAVYPLATPCPAIYWRRLFAWAQGRAGGHLDPACKNEGRVYYLPSGPSQHRWAHDFTFGPLLDLDYATLPETPEERAIALVRERAATPARPLHVTGAQVDRAKRALLNGNAIVRERVAHALGGSVVSGRATGVRCPSCGRASVWWPLSPLRTPQAMCNHRSSCNWTGYLDSLLEHHGQSI